MFEAHDRRPRYEILRVVNRGGMGEIALALAKGVKGFEKLVVLKRLRADAEREDHIQMFDVEQEVMSRIEHPNIVKVFDQPYIEGIPYMAMEYIRGRNLDQIVRAAMQSGRELPLHLCLTAISEVLRGLAFVHRLKDNDGRPLGVVHQDMTPSNVLVSFFGEVKITDFGISYVTSRDGGLRKGVLKGKPRYVAPEVLAGKRVNNRADIYGVGVVLYELLTGQALFARPTVKETLAAVARNELPDFERELARFGPGVAQILDRSLKKDPADRYRTAEAMAADVLNELSKRGGPMPPATLGYVVRQLFQNDPDVPEMDPAFEQAITRGPSIERPESLAPRNLDETLQELDRLLGPSKSVDLFTLPPELAMELDDLKDMEPFSGETPLPDFVWRAKSEQEILQRAEQQYGPGAASLVGEPPPLFAREGVAGLKESPLAASAEPRPSSPGVYAQVRAPLDRGPRPAPEPHERPQADPSSTVLPFEPGTIFREIPDDPRLEPGARRGGAREGAPDRAPGGLGEPGARREDARDSTLDRAPRGLGGGSGTSPASFKTERPGRGQGELPPWSEAPDEGWGEVELAAAAPSVLAAAAAAPAPVAVIDATPNASSPLVSSNDPLPAAACQAAESAEAARGSPPTAPGPQREATSLLPRAPEFWRGMLVGILVGAALASAAFLSLARASL